MRTFVLERDTDITGISGVGRIAEGVEFSDGRVTMRWMTDTATTVDFDHIGHVEHIHGHAGATRIVWQ